MCFGWLRYKWPNGYVAISFAMYHIFDQNCSNSVWSLKRVANLFVWSLLFCCLSSLYVVKPTNSIHLIIEVLTDFDTEVHWSLPVSFTPRIICCQQLRHLSLPETFDKSYQQSGFCDEILINFHSTPKSENHILYNINLRRRIY